MIPDISEIGEIAYSWDFDQDEYEEYLQDNGLEKNQDTLLEYISNYVTFEMEFYDSQYYHRFATDLLTLDEISNEFGDKLVNRILSDCSEKNCGSCETCEIMDDDIDINNPNELNDIARKLLQHGEYYKNCRGFILSDGDVVYTPNEHNQCTIINGVKNTFHFISLGNIRVLPNSIDIGKQPTPQQRNVLRQVINSYANDELYLDIFDNGHEYSCKYNNPQWRYVLGEIDRYYNEGIKPMGKEFYNENKKKHKTIIIDEDKEQELIGNILNEVFYPTAEKVLYVTSYLDKNFSRQLLDSLDDNGYPTKENTVVLLSNEKQPLKTLNMKELLRLLDDKFEKIISKKEDRRKFLKQVIKDWYFKNKGIKTGMLSVNYLK